MKHELTVLNRQAKTLSLERLEAIQVALGKECVGLFAFWYFIRRIELYYDVARGQLTHFDPIGLAGFLPAPIPPIVVDLLFALMLLLIAIFTLGWHLHCEQRFYVIRGSYWQVCERDLTDAGCRNIGRLN